MRSSYSEAKQQILRSEEKVPPTITKRLLDPTLWIFLSIVSLGVIAGVLVGLSPILLVAAALVPLTAYFFIAEFERVLIGLLIIRSSLDAFSDQQLPAAYAIGLNALIILYISIEIFKGKSIQTDWFWWLFAGWVTLQGMWVILMPLGGLGLDNLPFQNSLREWVRLVSWLLVYLIVLQLRGKVAPQKIIDMLFLCLVVPFIAAAIQITIPSASLPEFLRVTGGGVIEGEAGTRIVGTLGHSAVFGKFLFLMVCITYWRMGQAAKRLPWLVLLGVEVLIMTTTKSLTSLIMLLVFLITQSYLIFKNLYILFGVILMLGLVFAYFGYTEYGQARLSEILNTPMFNPEIDASRAIQLVGTDEGNSFVWRVKQWESLIKRWQYSPLLGYGLGTAKLIAQTPTGAHNDYVTYLAETGVMGLCAFIALLTAQFTRLYQLIVSSSKSNPRRSFCITLTCFLIAWCVGMTTDNVMNNTYSNFLWWTFLGLASFDWQSNKSEESELAVQKSLK